MPDGAVFKTLCGCEWQRKYVRKRGKTWKLHPLVICRAIFLCDYCSKYVEYETVPMFDSQVVIFDPLAAALREAFA